MDEVTEEWGYREDYDRLIEDLSGAILCELGVHGLTSPALECLIGALGVLHVRRDAAERSPTTGGSGGDGGISPGA